MNKLINFIKTAAYTVAIILSICLVFMVVVVSTAQASEPTALEREQARIQWIAERGQYQPDLTEPAKQEALVYTEQKQAEINRTWSKAMKRTTLSPWQCDNPYDYYAQFETESIERDEPEEDWREPEDADCEYWQSNCYGRG